MADRIGGDDRGATGRLRLDGRFRFLLPVRDLFLAEVRLKMQGFPAPCPHRCVLRIDAVKWCRAVDWGILTGSVGMRTLGQIFLRAALGLAGWAVIVGSDPVDRLAGDEPALEFLEALRSERMFDLAFAYLDQMESSPLASAEFRASIPLERAETMIQSTSQSRDLKFWEERLAAAEALLAEYAAQAPNEAAALRAQQSLANLRFRQARVYVMRSESDRLTAGERQQALERARTLLNECVKSFDQARDRLRSQIEKVTAAAANDSQAAEQLETLRNNYTQVRLRTPMARELLAETFSPDSPEFKQTLEAAAKEFKDIWDDYSRYAAGLEACLSAARCLNRVGKPKEGLYLLEEIFNQADTPSFRKIKIAAALIAVDCWDAQQPFPFAEAIHRLEPLIGALSREEQRQNDWLRLQFALARAYQAQAADMQANNRSVGDVNRVKRSAAVLLRIVSRNPSDVREAARQLMESSQLDAPPEETTPVETVIQSLGDALQKSIDMATDIETQYSELMESESLVSSAADAAAKQAAEATAREIEAGLIAAVNQLQSTLRQGLNLAEEDADIAQLNHVRYLQAYGYFVTRRYLEAGLMGEFMFQKFPGVEWTRQTCGLAVNAYAKQYALGSDIEKQFARSHLTELAARLVERWPGSAEANAAAAVMTRLALADKDLPAAERYFKDIGADSTVRAGLSQQLGQRNWENYRAEKAKLSAEELAARGDELATRLATARAALEQGVAGLGHDEITFEAAVTALLLVNAHLESGQVAAAVEQLETAGVAPLDLIKQKHPAIMNSPKSSQFISETYRTAINVYLSSLKTGVDSPKWIAKAQGILSALKQNLESRPGVNANEEMIAIYGLIATELRHQFQSISEPGQRINLAKNLLAFLTPLRESSRDAKTVMWIGATLIDTAAALPLDNPDAAALARELSGVALEALGTAEKIGFGEDPKAAARILELGRLKAVALTGQGKFEEAIQQYGAILSKKSTVLPIQIAAAETLQLWAAQSRSPKTFALAVNGTDSRRDPQTKRLQNTIWGWRQLVLVTRGKDEFKQDFYRCLFHLLECRIEYGNLADSPEALQAARQELENARSRDPELGGPIWKSKFAELERKLTQQAGK